jgi:hypothetical protein
MKPIGKFSLKVRKEGRGEWIPLNARLVTSEEAGMVVSDGGTFDTAEEAQEAKTYFLEQNPGIECKVFKTVQSEDGEVEEINIDALREDSD